MGMCGGVVVRCVSDMWSLRRYAVVREPLRGISAALEACPAVWCVRRAAGDERCG